MSYSLDTKKRNLTFYVEDVVGPQIKQKVCFFVKNSNTFLLFNLTKAPLEKITKTTVSVMQNSIMFSIR